MMRTFIQNNLLFIVGALLLLTSCNEVEIPSINEVEELPSINIIREGEIGWEIKDPCNIIYSDGTNTVELNAKIKKRGGVSSKFAKHSFSIELDNKFDFGYLPNDDDWILNANYIDKTFMRHKMSYDLYRQMDRKNIASKCLYVNVRLNNSKQGLYVLMEEVNGGMIGLDKTDSNAMIFKDPPLFYEKKIEHPQDPSNYYQQKFPDKEIIDKTEYIESFKDFIFYSTNIDFANKISNWVDIENIIDWHILLLFSNNSDGIMKNFYLYKLNSETPFRIAIWDYDHSFGRDGDNEQNMMERELDCNRSVLLKRLMQIPQTEYSEKLKNRWKNLRESDIISENNIYRHIEENDKFIQKGINENFDIWPIDAHWYFDDNNYQKEVNLIIEFVSLRISQLDNYFDGTEFN